MKVVFIGANPRKAEIAALSIRLRWPNVTPLVAITAAEGLALVEQVLPDIVLLHPDFSDMALSDALTALRRISQVPIMVLSQQGDAMEVVSALEMGADEYVRLPVDLTEMMARIWALLRRSGIGAAQERESPLMSGPLFINPATYEVFLEEQRLDLTSTEFRLLHLLVKSWGSVVSRQNLERVLWGETVGGSDLVKKYIQRLRRKLGDNARDPHWIISVHGVGYRFIGPDPQAVELPRPPATRSENSA